MHVGLVLPGFIATEGFPQRELVESARTRWMVSTPDKVGGRDHRRRARAARRSATCRAPTGIAAALRVVAPRLVRRVLGGGGAAMTPATGHGDS